MPHNRLRREALIVVTSFVLVFSRDPTQKPRVFDDGVGHHSRRATQSNMTWTPFDSGASIGSEGSESWPTLNVRRCKPLWSRLFKRSR
ncbi:MAG: hypothetical protein CMJ78_15360 [Planctomycetaceae bacterium]|nr:hypothetical protein [Planctomycetaceae bacterium]